MHQYHHFDWTMQSLRRATNLRSASSTNTISTLDTSGKAIFDFLN